MVGHHITLNWHLAGTLAGDHTLKWRAPFACTLVGVSAQASNNSDAKIEVGTSADTDGFKTAAVIGDSGAFTTWGVADWNGALISRAGSEPARLNAGDILTLVVDYDGAGGTAAQNLIVQAELTEG